MAKVSASEHGSPRVQANQKKSHSHRSGGGKVKEKRSQLYTSGNEFGAEFTMIAINFCLIGGSQWPWTNAIPIPNNKV